MLEKLRAGRRQFHSLLSGSSRLEFYLNASNIHRKNGECYCADCIIAHSKYSLVKGDPRPNWNDYPHYRRGGEDKVVGLYIKF